MYTFFRFDKLQLILPHSFLNHTLAYIFSIWYFNKWMEQPKYCANFAEDMFLCHCDTSIIGTGSYQQNSRRLVTSHENRLKNKDCKCQRRSIYHQESSNGDGDHIYTINIFDAKSRNRAETWVWQNVVRNESIN